ncbi:MAG: UDP-N-acetylmuramate dehydrogenase, partial [Cytophagales bacterium]|nr:UDP-N-acetylmuramate dehydrogenase [Cytophagales bacterium]
QNIGAYGVELKDVFVELEALDLLEGNLHIFDTEACDFGYRDSIFKREAKGRFIVTSVTLRLSKEPDYNVQYGALQKTLNEMGVKELSVKAVSDAVVRIRETKLPDPAVMGNCGSFFKNPVITQELFERIKNDYPDMPSYPQGEGIVKVAAGWLIEQCGWKGFKEGGVGVHDRQALVLVNLGDGSGHAVRELSERIQRSVLERFKIRLNPEVNII